MPSDDTAATTLPASLMSPAGVPIQEIKFPHSPSPLPAWLTGESLPVYSSPPARTAIPPAPHITAGFGHGGVPASGTLYGGVDGPLFHGSSFWPHPVPSTAPSAAAPVPFGAAAAPAAFGAAAAPAAFGAAEFQPKSYKLDFTTYDGSVDPLNWLTHCEQFFWGQRTPVEQRTWMASYHLTGVAQTWYYALLLDEGMPSWERFKELCRLRFGPPIYGSRLAELGRLPFHSTVQEFADRFQAILAHSRDISTRQKAELFVGGLPEHIRVDVAMRAPPDLQSAMFLARAFESRATATAALQPAADSFVAPSLPRPGLPTPRHPVAGPSVTTGATLAVPTPLPAPAPSFRRLTPEELLERRRQGLCYNCDEPYVRGHQCKRLFYLESADFLDDDVPAAVATDAVFQHEPGVG
jgi:hypothetical protein